MIKGNTITVEIELPKDTASNIINMINYDEYDENKPGIEGISHSATRRGLP